MPSRSREARAQASSAAAAGGDDQRQRQQGERPARDQVAAELDVRAGPVDGRGGGVDGADGGLDRAAEGADRPRAEVVELIVVGGKRALARRRDRDRVDAVRDQRRLLAEPGGDREPGELRERGLPRIAAQRLGLDRELGRAFELHRGACLAGRAADHERRRGRGGAGLRDHDHRVDRVALGQVLDQRADAGRARGGAAGRGEHVGLRVLALAEGVRELEQDAGRGGARGGPRRPGRVAGGGDHDPALAPPRRAG